MTIFFYDDDIEKRSINTNSIFLAGPTRRGDNTRTSWRRQALELISLHTPAPDVFVPEFRDGHFSMERFSANYSPVAWETTGLARASCVLFWMPFDRGDYLGLTTRSEVAAELVRAKRMRRILGVTPGPHRWALGMPPNTPADGYIRHHAALAGLPIHETLEATVAAALGEVDQ